MCLQLLQLMCLAPVQENAACDQRQHLNLEALTLDGSERQVLMLPNLAGVLWEGADG